jgi:hypothetical protein
MHRSFQPESHDFSMVLGGPLYQLLRRVHILRDPLQLLGRRVITIAAIAWLPLLILAATSGRALAGVKIPFLYDIDTHVRFLASLPLLILAEWLVHMRFRPLVLQFFERDIVLGDQVDRFDAIIASSLRLRNSVVAEVILVVLVITLGPVSWRNQTAIHASTWYADVTADHLSLTSAGMYYRFVALPVFQFILLRWYFRIFIWSRFLWKVSRLKLNLMPAHPDGAGGLGFLTGTAHALAPLLVAQSALVAGLIANRIFYDNAKLTEFKMEILAIEVFLLVLALGPLIVFVGPLMACQRLGNRQYGTLASRYTNDFHQKWIEAAPPQPAQEPLLGSGDIQSLADLGNSFAVIRTMSPVPFTKTTVLRLAAVTALPLLPLTLTVIPFDQILEHLLKALL